MVDIGSTHALKAELGSKPEVLIHGELFDEQVVLRYKANQRLRLRLGDAMTIDGDGALLGRERTIEQRE